MPLSLHGITLASAPWPLDLRNHPGGVGMVATGERKELGRGPMTSNAVVVTGFL